VLDLGAGTGAITAALVAVGARVVAVELHPERAALLRQRFPAVRVVQTDLADLRLPRRPFTVVANPPFASSASVIRRLLRSDLEHASIVLPRPLVHRWVRTRPPRFHVACGARIPTRAFDPPITTPTAVLRIDRTR
jgi:23S rRNA (adenine-N6)-dimethyltransferase